MNECKNTALIEKNRNAKIEGEKKVNELQVFTYRHKDSQN